MSDIDSVQDPIHKNFDAPVVVETHPGIDPELSIIWLHGLGADGNDFVPVVPHLALPDALPVRFIFPQAPVRPVTINGGFKMRAWYDILDMSIDRTIEHRHLAESAAYCDALIHAEIAKGVANENIIIVGFSQGGAVALHTALQSKVSLGALVCLSTYLVTDEQLEKALSESDRKLPIFWGHGEHDDVVAYDYGQRSAAQLKEWGYSVDWFNYPIAHEVCIPELKAIGAFIANR